MSSQGLSFPISQLPTDLVVHLLADIYLLDGDFRLVNSHYRYMLREFEASICARIIKEFFSFEARCFPPGDFFRGHRNKRDSGNEAYTKFCRENGLTFRPSTYEYIDFLQYRSRGVKYMMQEITEELEMDDGPGFYRNFLVLWCLTAGGSWSSSMRSFAKLPKQTQLSFNDFLDDLAQRWADQMAPDLACAFLGHKERSDNHVNYEDHWIAAEVSMQLPDDTSELEIMALGISKLYLKHFVLLYGAEDIMFPITGFWLYGYDCEMHGKWFQQMDLMYRWDKNGGYYTVWFCDQRPWGGDIIKGFNKALSLPEGTPLEQGWAEQNHPHDVPTAIYSRASYWDKLGEWYDHETDLWYTRKWYGDWTDFDFNLPRLLDENFRCASKPAEWADMFSSNDPPNLEDA